MAGVLGFRVLRPLTFDNLQKLVITDAIPFVYQRQCPACADRDLAVLAILCEGDGKKKIRVGYCPGCGYAGYIDRPTGEWIADFYSSGMWDKTRGQGEEKSKRRITEVSRGHFGKKNDTVRMIETIDVDRRQPVLEIGCGYGESLGQLKHMGFERLVGIEHSPRRADVAGSMGTAEVLTGAFEAPAIQRSLESRAPFSLIFSHHTLEHVYDPAEFVAHAGRLQREGDYLVLSVPNVIGESSMAILTFLPHLHSFSHAGLSQLLERSGYKVIDSSLTSTRILNMVARKNPGRSHPFPAAESDIGIKMREKISRGLGFDGSQLQSPLRRLWWYKKEDIGGQIVYFANPFLEALHYAVASRIIARRFKDIVPNQELLSLEITDLDRKVMPGDTAPFLIQFDGPLFLLYK